VFAKPQEGERLEEKKIWFQIVLKICQYMI